MDISTDIITIKSVEDVKDFFRAVHGAYPYEWHPDDEFEFFLDDNEQRVFTDEEAARLNAAMVSCFQYCDDHEQDIYEVAGEVQLELWKRQGVWKDGGQPSR